MRSRIPQGPCYVPVCGEVCSPTKILICVTGVRRERILHPEVWVSPARNNINRNPPWGGSLNQASRSKILLMVAISKNTFKYRFLKPMGGNRLGNG